MADEVIRLNLDVDSQDAVKAAANIEALEGQLRDLENAYARGTVAVNDYQKEFARLNAEIGKVALAGASAPGLVAAGRASVAAPAPPPVTATQAVDTSQVGLAMERAAEKAFMLNRELRELQAGYRAGAVGAAEYADRAAKINASLSANAAASRAAGAAASGAAGGTRNFGLAAMQAAQFADDMQYGMRGVVNNIPLLLTSLGVGGGLAGVLSVVAVGINQVVQHWDELTHVLGVGGNFGAGIDQAKLLDNQLKALGKTIDELEAKPGLTFWDVQELEQARETSGRIKAGKETQAGAEKLLGGPTAEEKERQAGMAQAVADVTPQVFKDALLSALQGQTDEFGTVRDPATGRRKTPEAMVSRLAAQAGAGDKFAIDYIQKILTDAFGKGNPIAAAIRENTPEAVAEWERVTDAAITSGRAAAQSIRDNAELAKAAAEERRKAAEDAGELRKAIAQGDAAAMQDAIDKMAGTTPLTPEQRLANLQLTEQGKLYEPGEDEMQVARRQAAVNDYKRASERAMQASMQADLARTGPGRMGVMQRQQIMRQYKAMGNMRRGTGGGRMGIMRRQLAAKAGFGGDREREVVGAIQKQVDAATLLREAAEALQREGIQAVL